MAGTERFVYELDIVRSVAGIRQNLAEDALRLARANLDTCDEQIRDLIAQRDRRLSGIRVQSRGETIDLEAYRALDIVVKGTDREYARLLAVRKTLERDLEDAMQKWISASHRKDAIDEHFDAEEAQHARELSASRAKVADEDWLLRRRPSLREST